MYKLLEIETGAGDNIIDITAKINQSISESTIKEGICVLFVPHTTAGIAINSSMDTATLEDLIQELRRLVPTRVDFHHTYDTPADSAGHIKSTIIGHSISLLITKGELFLGKSQSVLFFEFDGPRTRQLHLRVLSE